VDSKGGCYVSYLLRLWPVHSEGTTIWRASLESPHTGERRGFASLADLFAFLEKETGHRPCSNGPANGDAPLTET
jgi:hypothetical protein